MKIERAILYKCKFKYAGNFVYCSVGLFWQVLTGNSELSANSSAEYYHNCTDKICALEAVVSSIPLSDYLININLKSQRFISTGNLYTNLFTLLLH